MTNFTWTFSNGGNTSYASGNWSTSGDWSSTGTPSSGDQVYLYGVKSGSQNGANYTVTLTGDVTVASLTMQSSLGTSNARGPTLALNGYNFTTTTLSLFGAAAGAVAPVIEGTGSLTWTTPGGAASTDAPIIEATGGTLTVNGDIASGLWSGPTFEVDASSVLNVQGSTISGDSGNNFTFLNSSSGEIEFAAPSGAEAVVISGLTVSTLTGSTTTPTSLAAATNFIDVANTPTSDVSLSGNTLTVNEGGGNTLTATLGGGTYYAKVISDGGSGSDIFLSNVVCYAAGTRIRTPDGDVPVESLREDDLVVTVHGKKKTTAPVVWIGYRKVDLAAHPRPEFVAPVRVKRGAFGSNLPRRDLVMSPDHAVLVDGKLVICRMLINHATITQEFHARSVEYYHIELAKHAILLAEGLPAESYLDTGNRAMFANAGLAVMLHPDFGINHGLKNWDADACAPLVTDAAAVEPMWRRLMERAGVMGYAAPHIETTKDADLHLMVDGRRVQPVSAHNGHHVFVLPRQAASARLASRASAPADIVPYHDDRRLLGVAVSRIILRSGADQTEIPVDHPLLTRGWHDVERAGTELCRWTNGDAHLPIACGDENGPLTLEVRTTRAHTYRLVAPQLAHRRGIAALRLVA